MIGKDWSLLWASPDSLKAIVDRTGIKIGSKLYAHPAPSDQEKLADLLTKAVGDITAALTMAGKQGKIAAWTKPYVDALNEHDTRARQPGAAS